MRRHRPNARDRGAVAGPTTRLPRDQARHRRWRMDGANRLYESLGFRDIPSHRYNPVRGARFMEAALDDS